MVHTFELSNLRRAKVWLDDAPPANFAAMSVIRRRVRPLKTIPASRHIAAVELSVPHGPRASYALLGAELMVADVDGVELVVSTNERGLPLETGSGFTSDDVNVGLLDEYATAVLDGAATTLELLGGPQGAALQFRWAAHGRVGSSRAIFENASRIVLRLLMLPKESSEDQIRELFR